MHPPGRLALKTRVRRRTEPGTNTGDYTEAAWLSGKGTGFRARLPGFESQPVTCALGFQDLQQRGSPTVYPHTNVMALAAEPGSPSGTHRSPSDIPCLPPQTMMYIPTTVRTVLTALILEPTAPVILGGKAPPSKSERLRLRKGINMEVANTLLTPGAGEQCGDPPVAM